MTDEDPQNYEIESIQRADAPAGAEGSAWCRYVIKRGDSKIRGYRQGSVKTVTLEVKEMVEQMNDRRSGKRSPTAPPKRRTKH
jgi:hypothetical protein